MQRLPNRIILLSSAALLSACSNNNETAAVTIAPFAPATASFNGSGNVPTSSSGETLNSMLAALNNPADGVDMPFLSVDITTNKLINSALEIGPINDSVSTSSPLSPQVNIHIDGKIANGEVTRVGEYGAHFLSDLDNENINNGIAGRNGYIGILTDSNDKPTTGVATYSGSSRVIYQNRSTSTNQTYTGDLNSSFTANFSFAIVSGSTAGNLTHTNDSSLVLPASITYNPANIQNSSFQSSGFAVIESTIIPMQYQGSFFGPQAAEMGYVAGNRDSGDITVLDYGYFEKQ